MRAGTVKCRAASVLSCRHGGLLGVPLRLPCVSFNLVPRSQAAMRAGALPEEPIVALDEVQSEEALLHPLDAAIGTIVQVETRQGAGLQTLPAQPLV